jgi:hypothetical protein
MPSKSPSSNGSSAEVLTVSGISAAIVTVGIWAAKQFYKVDVPATLAAPLTTIVSAIGTLIYILVRALLSSQERGNRDRREDRPADGA